MFMCSQCLEQYDDQELTYTLILESRLDHPAADSFVLKFCSRAHVQEFLERIQNQRQFYVLTRVTKGAAKRFDPAYPIDLLILVGSTKVS